MGSDVDDPWRVESRLTYFVGELHWSTTHNPGTEHKEMISCGHSSRFSSRLYRNEPGHRATAKGARWSCISPPQIKKTKTQPALAAWYRSAASKNWRHFFLPWQQVFKDAGGNDMQARQVPVTLRQQVSCFSHDGSCWEIIIIKQIHTFTSNILIEQRRFGLGCPSLDKGWGNPDQNVVAQSICCWWMCGFAWWTSFLFTASQKENNHWKHKLQVTVEQSRLEFQPICIGIHHFNLLLVYWELRQEKNIQRQHKKNDDCTGQRGEFRCTVL